MLKRGKKIYRTSMLFPAKWFLFALFLFFYHDLYLATFGELKFLEAQDFSVLGVIRFHLKYPVEFITLTSLVLPSFLYYAFFRGVVFFEQGILYNKGIPFLNVWVPYSDCASYRLVSPKALIALTTKSGEVFLIGSNNMSRVIAALDQHEVKGELGTSEYIKLARNLKIFFYAVSVFTISLYLCVRLGVFRFIS
ncbi:MAG: hypothetical protein LW878_11250 [Proteobacteria bacterium]|nr:hypothetical protein [Pseudomonadota bacterium]